ncbi:MAG: 3-hydroxyisobutyrate dehydrogenase [Bacteriovoracales bacterium]|nr:3-hydroxyisobutyrate dehydrogenase [Bacteriovoracales bacterium]
MNIAFFGLGNMGLPMALNLVKAGHRVVGRDLSPKAQENFVREGGFGADSIPKVLEGAEAVISMLPSGEAAKELYLGEGGILEHGGAGPDGVLIDCSTIAAMDAVEIAEKALSHGFDMIDAPVSGGVAGAKSATLTFIVGGEAKGLEKARKALSLMGKNIFHVGGAGAGQVAKICNNMLLATHMIGTAEALNLGAKHGLDPLILSEMMKQSSGDNWSLQQYNPYPGVMAGVPATRDYEGGFGTNLMLKDLNLAMEAAKRAKARTPLGKRAKELYESHAQDFGGLDFSSILKSIDKDEKK